MPLYEYHCPANGRTVEVRHGMSARIETWGALAGQAGLAPEDTPSDAPVERLLSTPGQVGAAESAPAPSGGACGSPCGCFPRA